MPGGEGGVRCISICSQGEAVTSVSPASVGWSVGRIPKYHRPQVTFKGSLRRSVQLLNISNLPQTSRCYFWLLNLPTHSLDIISVVMSHSGSVGLVFPHILGLSGAQLPFPNPIFGMGKVKGRLNTLWMFSAVSAVSKWFKITRFGWGWFFGENHVIFSNT